MYKAAALCILLAFTAIRTTAQTNTDSVKIAVFNLFSAMRNADSAGIRNCFTDSAIMQTIARDRNGSAVVKNEKVIYLASSIAAVPRGVIDERINFDMVKIEGLLATAWTSYKFYISGKLHHCGVNSFQLVKVNGKWKIQYLIDTRRTQPCD